MKVHRGFTVVELLVAIVIITILAAVTLVAYNSIQNDAHDSAVQGDLKDLARQFEMFGVRQVDGTFPDSVEDLEAINGVGITKDSYLVDSTVPNNLVVCSSSSSTRFSIAAISKSGKRLFITDRAGVQEYTGTVNWFGADNNSRMCSSTLPSSTAVLSGSGWNGSWNLWTNG